MKFWKTGKMGDQCFPKPKMTSSDVLSTTQRWTVNCHKSQETIKYSRFRKWELENFDFDSTKHCFN